MTKDELKNRISMALKDPVLQQGFEIICKNLAELENENAKLKKTNLDIQDAVTMQMYTNKANKEIANRQLTKARELLKKFIYLLKDADYVFVLKNTRPTLDEAEQFLKEVNDAIL